MAENYVQEQIEASAARFFSCPEAEENILRRMFKVKGVAEDVIDELTGADFADITLGRLFSAIKLVVQNNGQVDFATVDAAFTKRFPKSSEQIRERMLDLVAPKPYTLENSQSIADHVRIVKELSVRRNAIRQIDTLANGLRDPSKDIDEMLAEIRETVDKVDADGGQWTTIGNVLLSSFDYLEKRQKGEIKAITSGIASLDRIIGGFFGGELNIIAARPSVGKSAFAVNLALAAARQGFKVGLVSLEMTDIGFGQRILSRGAWLEGSKIRAAQIDVEAWTRLAGAMNDMSDLPIEFMFKAPCIEDICNSARRKAKRGELDMLVLDYIGITQTHKRFRELREKIGYITWSLKQLALQANIPVVALAQVNRDAQGQMPTMANLRDSGNIEQDADNIIFLHKPTDPKDQSLSEIDGVNLPAYIENGTPLIVLGVAKQRQGKVGKTTVMFNPENMCYTEMIKEEP
jgi:replicative DNA helicase